MTSLLKPRYIRVGCDLNHLNSSVDGIGMAIAKIKYLSNKKYCILRKGRTIEKGDVERLDFKSEKVSGSSIRCHKLVAAWVIASVSCSRSKRIDSEISCRSLNHFDANIRYR